MIDSGQVSAVRHRGPILLIAGTRPEIIKLAPVYVAARALFDHDEIQWLSTGQHQALARETLAGFGIEPSHSLGLGDTGGSLLTMIERISHGIGDVLVAERPALAVVQGDTASAFAGAMAAFHHGIPVAHVEAGLRTYDNRDPYPEEAYRRMIDVIAAIRFAPTHGAAGHLRSEGCRESSIYVTGNTAVDAVALAGTAGTGQTDGLVPHSPSARLLFVTLHRRESWGGPLEAMCLALRDIVERFDDVEIVLPLHVNPQVQRVIAPLLSGRARIKLLPPLDFASCQAVMKQAHLILTDSGGIQEEAPSHGVPVLVLRRSTERPEAVDAGLAIVTGTGREEIVEMASRLLQDTELHARMRDRRNPFGDGNAAARIAKALYRFVRDDYPLLTTQEQFSALRHHADRRSWAGELAAGVRNPEPKRVHDDCRAEAAK